MRLFPFPLRFAASGLHTHNFILIDFLIVGGAVDGVYSEVALQRKSRCMIIAEGTPSEWIMDRVR